MHWSGSDPSCAVLVHKCWGWDGDPEKQEGGGGSTVLHPTPRSPTGSPELPFGAQPLGNAHFPSIIPAGRAEEFGDGGTNTLMSRSQSHPRLSLVSLMSSIPLPKGSQSRIWPIFNPTSSSWKPSQHYFFCLPQVRKPLFSLGAICSEHFQNEGN